jgi:MYXO-CTERM domain-containing protein
VAVRKTILVIFLLAVGVLVAPAPPVWACSCAQIDSLGFADTAFVGKALSIDQSADESVIVFEVDSMLKGSADGRIAVRTSTNEASCGFGFAVGRSYRVFAKAGRTTLCSGNTEVTPTPVVSAVGVPPDPEPSGGATSKSRWAIGTGVGLVVLGLLLIRRRRKSG